MATQTYPVQIGPFFPGGSSDLASRRLAWTVAVSLLLHLTVVVVAAGIRFANRSEQPLASVQVSLVSLPTMPRPVEAAPSKPTPAPTPSKPAPAPAPAARREATVVKRASADMMRDVLREIELPPDAPQVGDLSPSKPVGEQRSNNNLRKEVDSLLGKLNVPDLRTPPVEPSKPAQTAPDRSSFSDEADRELEKELKKLQSPPLARKIQEPVSEDKPQTQELPARPMPPVTAKMTSAKAPETALKVPGSSSGSNQYLARVQAIIGSKWTAPPVDVSGQSLAVVIQFHLDRSGKVSRVRVERSSGNGYYDDAGQRAVLSATLPAFPPEMTDSSLDAHFTFSVGEQAG